MRKVTKRLLTACVAVLAVSACQDSVTVIQPDPPPPPPPPPAVDATVSILGLRAIPGPGSVNPTAVAGDINVALNVEEGDNTVTAIDLLFDGAPIGCQAINVNRVPGEGISLSAAGAADEVECFWDTNAIAGACDGSNVPPAFGNGTHTLGAQITLDDGTTRTADNQQQVTLVNGSFILVTTDFDMASTVGTNGRPFWGGPEDRDGDGTDDNVNAFAACPVSYNGTVVGTMSAVATTDGPVAADLGAGLGAVATDSSEPFVFVLDSGDNDTVEDNPTTGFNGHTVMSTGSIFDDGGLNVTAEFAHGAVGGNQTVYLDFTAPVVAAGASVEIDATPTVIGHYSEGDFTMTGVTDAGVGFTFGAGSTIAVGDCATAANIDGAFSTAFVPIAGNEDVIGVDDLEEDDAFIDADANAADCYVPEVTNLEDDLGNVTDLSAVPTAAPADATINSATNWGVDRTAVAISNLMPDTDPADDPVVILNDVSFMFDLDEPDLVSGDPGAGIDLSGCNGPLDGVACTNITATEGTNAWEVDDPSLAALPAAGTFTVDIADVGGFAGGAMADGPHTITIDVADVAIPANESSDDFTIILDTTPPVFGALNPAPVGSAGTDAAAIVMTIGGTITDANEIATSVLSVFDAVNGVCGDGDDVKLAVGSGANQVDVNDVDLTNATNSITFNQSFTIQQPSAAAVAANYCFLISAEDGAVDKTGAANPNMAMLNSIVAVTWNVG